VPICLGQVTPVHVVWHSTRLWVAPDGSFENQSKKYQRKSNNQSRQCRTVEFEQRHVA
jgi:hypothetical protein